MARSAHACTAADFATVVDETALALRDLNAAGAQRFQEKLKDYQQKHDLSDSEIRARAAAVQDDKMSDFNREIEQLVAEMDTLSNLEPDKVNCEKLEDLKRVRDRLLTVMGQKSGYMLARADIELDRPAGSSAPQEPETAQAQDEPAAQPPVSTQKSGKQDQLASRAPEPARPAPEADTQQQQNAAPEADASPPAERAEAAPVTPDLPERRSAGRDQVAGNWDTDARTVSPPVETDQQTAYVDPGASEPPVRLGPGVEHALPPPVEGPIETHYTIDEISDAGRGLFGPVTAQLAAAINYAFQRFGQPNAYIVGSEGGAAFLAGLRYGKGMLHTKTDGQRVIYWQGPSLGVDMGAEGSDALFLVYNMNDTENLFGRFTGIGGSAYAAGGVGLNVLAKSGMIMVPIRTGLGLRLGANLAYLKFTERQTWNPF
ncbi:MAG: EipA family protein [Rhodomicrobiaceae bacterium]